MPLVFCNLMRSAAFVALFSPAACTPGFEGEYADPAKAEIVGETVVVSNDQVQSPTAVRYGWTQSPDVNLFNQEGLPASPFRTDIPPEVLGTPTN